MTTKVRGISNNAIHNVHLNSGIVHNVNLADDSVDSDVISNNILGQVNGPSISLNDPTNYRLGKVITDYSASSFATTSGTLSDMLTSSQYTGFTGGSALEFFMHYPARNDTETWSGGYIEPNLSFDNGSNYYSMGTCGYDGGIMMQNGYAILCYNNHYFISNSATSRIPSTDYSLKIKWRFAVYSGTYQINGAHDINGGSGASSSYVDTSATVDRYQHYMHWIIKEWIPVT